MYCDVKLENILVIVSDFVYLVDFGIVCVVFDLGLIQIGIVVGIYNYMVLEWFIGDEVIYCVDIYVLVCVLGECLIGVLLYWVDSVEWLIVVYLMDFVLQFSQLWFGCVLLVLDQVIVKGMVKNFVECFMSVGDLVIVVYDVFNYI